MEHSKLVIRQVAGRWIFGSEAREFEAFEARGLALARAKAFRAAHPDVDVVIVDADGRERPVKP